MNCKALRISARNNYFPNTAILSQKLQLEFKNMQMASASTFYITKRTQQRGIHNLRKQNFGLFLTTFLPLVNKHSKSK